MYNISGNNGVVVLRVFCKVFFPVQKAMAIYIYWWFGMEWKKIRRRGEEEKRR